MKKELTEEQKLRKKEYQKTWRQLNKNKRNEYEKKRRKQSSESFKKIRKKSYEKNKDKNKEYGKIYYKEKNKGKKLSIERRNKINKRTRERKITDSLFRLKHGISNRIRFGFKKGRYTKKSRTHQILGCSFVEFKSYIESLWKPWMNWNNYGSINKKPPTDINQCWDFDHIIPLSTALTEEDIIRLNHWTNFQPLCSYVNRNIKKNNVIPALLFQQI